MEVPVEVVTAARTETASRRAAAALAARGLRAGDRVALALPGSGDLLALVLGALRTGVVPVVLDPASPPAERAVLLQDADPALVVDSPAALAALLAEEARAELADVPLARPMHYTSGTTGRRKGVWSGVLDEPAARALVAEEAELWGFAADDRHLLLSPLHHSAPLRFATLTLLAGGTVLLPGPFDPAAVLAAVAEHAPTSAFCVPAHLQRLHAHAAAHGGWPSTSSFRLLAHAGAPCPPPVRERTVEVMPAGSVWEFYGSTEGQFTACRAQEQVERPGTVGRARPGRTLSVDADGVIWCAVPDRARFSYWRDPERTAAAWRGDAFTVGDLGRLDAEGYLYLDGRREDLVISGGVNVYPAEVEQVLAGCPGVLEVAVFGVDDEQWGQRVCAAVVRAPGMGEVAPEAVRGWARERLGPAKRPKDVYVVEDLPRTSTGKVRRLDLPGVLGLG
ncbi:MAG TPA: class I adenylate-forming enzyme family protein [Motilibacteraceae bacterium]|nr:class I adenylate-forming enzyme family protein [Motilibacteraceae bacterium]